MLKRLFTISTIILYFSVLTQAQSEEQEKGFFIGTHTAINSAWVVNQNNYETLEDCPAIAQSELDYQLTWGYNVGVMAGYQFSERVALKLGILFSKGGQDYEDTFNPGLPCPTPYHVQRAVELSYMQIPLLVNYRLPLKGRLHYNFSIGPLIGLLRTFDEQVFINDAKKISQYRIKDKFQTFDWGISFETGIDIHVVSGFYIQTGLSTYYAISDLNGDFIKNEEWFSKNDVEYQSSHNFRLGWFIGFNYLFKKADKPFEE